MSSKVKRYFDNLALVVMVLALVLAGLIAVRKPPASKAPADPPNPLLHEGIREATWKGHHYLIFATRQERTVVHDPDCPCHTSPSVERPSIP